MQVATLLKEDWFIRSVTVRISAHKLLEYKSRMT